MDSQLPFINIYIYVMSLGHCSRDKRLKQLRQHKIYADFLHKLSSIKEKKETKKTILYYLKFHLMNEQKELDRKEVKLYLVLMHPLI